MIETPQSNFTPEALGQLQRLRVSVLAFQNEIAPLPAGEQSNARNEQFNQLRLEAKALLKEQDFDKKVPKAMTDELLGERAQQTVIPRLSVIVIFWRNIGFSGVRRELNYFGRLAHQQPGLCGQ
ncbi:hypothetical protein ACFLXQ_03405 [Chloroflexota bacterium]